MFLILFTLTILSACSAPKIDLGSLTTKPLVKTEKVDAVDWRQGGRKLLLVSDGLKQIDLNTGVVQSISDSSPDLVRWRQNDIVALYRTEDGSRIDILTSAGEVIKSSLIKAKISELFVASDQSLLACGVELTHHSFGVNVATVVYRWEQGAEDASRILLDETIIHPRVWQLVEDSVINTEFALSPWGDDLAFAAVHDPPAFPPYRHLKVMHLSTAAVRSVIKGEASGMGLGYSTDGELIYFANGEGQVHLYNEWTGEVIGSMTMQGDRIAHWHKSGNYQLDGVLYIEKTSIADYGSAVKLYFSPNGKEFVMVKDDWIYLISGLQNDPAMPDLNLDRQEIIRLRKWRALGLISPEEYFHYKEKVENNE